VYGSDVLQDSTISVNEKADLPDSLFAAAATATVSNYPSCSGGSGGGELSALQKKVQPDYPQNARISRHQGTVELYAIIDKDGRVQNLRPVGETWPELQRAAMQAVAKWKYTPYLRCGLGVEYEALIRVNFSLSAF